MPQVEEDIGYLIQIVKKDLKIQEKVKFLEEAPARIRKIEGIIYRMNEELDEIKSQVGKLEKERRHIEGVLESQQGKIREKKEELNSVKSNKVYRALNTEIDYLTKLVNKEEERMLQILEELEKKNKEIGVLSEKNGGEKIKLEAEKQLLEKEIESARSDLEILEDEKVRILPHISERVQRLYKRILEVKRDSGVANLIGDICQGCYSRVPPQKAHEIRRNDRILTCEVCGRILVYYQLG